MVLSLENQIILVNPTLTQTTQKCSSGSPCTDEMPVPSAAAKGSAETTALCSQSGRFLFADGLRW